MKTTRFIAIAAFGAALIGLGSWIALRQAQIAEFGLAFDLILAASVTLIVAGWLIAGGAAIGWLFRKPVDSDATWWPW